MLGLKEDVIELNPEEVEKELRMSGAILSGHFVYASGEHGDTHVDAESLYPKTTYMFRLTRALAHRFKDLEIHAVIGPAQGGIILSQWVAHHSFRLNGWEVWSVYAEKGPGNTFDLKPHYAGCLQGNNVLIVDDVLTKGTTVSAVSALVKSFQGNVVGVGVLCNRGGVKVEDLREVPRLESLLDLKLQSWPAESCPLCTRGFPVDTHVGWGKQFLEAQKQGR